MIFTRTKIAMISVVLLAIIGLWLSFLPISNESDDIPSGLNSISLEVGEFVGSEWTVLYQLVEINGCQYIRTKDGYSGGITHAGNCPNHQSPE